MIKWTELLPYFHTLWRQYYCLPS